MSAILAMMAAATSTCALPPGWDAVAARNTQYVIFGELHGTRQAPTFVGDVVCALAKQRKRVLLALEINSREDADLQAAWHQPRAKFAATARATVRDWSQEFAGGPMTQATLEMLDRLHAAKAKGAAIDVVAFNGAKDADQAAKFSSLPGQGPHEAAQAENIRLAAERGRYDKVIVLVGNMHAMKKPVTRRGIEWRPMAMYLASPDQVTSLNMSYGAGTSFTCQLRDGVAFVPGKPPNADDIECRARLTPEFQGPMTGGRAIRIGDVPPIAAQGQFDGLFWVGPIEAVGPAKGAATP